MNDICAEQSPPVGQNIANLAALGDRTDMPLQALKTRLDIYEEAILRTVYGQDGKPIAFDEVSPFDLAAAFAGLSVGTGLLPRDTLWCRRAGREYTIGIYLPPATRALRIAGVEGALTLPLPPLVFAGMGTTYSVYALGSPDWPGARSVLYHAPFPNVYAAGNICAGTVHFPACAPGTIHEAAALFFESEFNRDLDDRRSRKYPHDVSKLWRDLIRDAMAEYPLGDLVEMGKALGDLVED